MKISFFCCTTALLTGCFLSGCATLGGPDIAGKWTGQARTQGSPPVSWLMVLDQTGSTFSGTYRDDTGLTGNLTGTLDGEDGAFVLQLNGGFRVASDFVIEGDEWTSCAYTITAEAQSPRKGSCSATR